MRPRLSIALVSFASALSTGLAHAQDAGQCPVGGFDICFPNVSAGAPGAACEPEVPDATPAAALERSVVSACLANVCAGKGSEPEPGFFSFCCAAGGSVQYDDFCVLVTQTACPDVAASCAERCPPLALLTGGVTLAAPPEACLADYPPAIASVCQADPFCCSTSWDVLCSSAAVAAGAPVASLISAPLVSVAANASLVPSAAP